MQNSKEKLYNVQKEKAVLMSHIIMDNIMLLMLENKWTELQKIFEQYPRNYPTLREIRIFHPENGRIIASNERDEVGKRIYAADWERFKAGEVEPFIIMKKQEVFATAIRPIRNTPECYKCHSSQRKVIGVLDVEISLASAKRAIMEIRRQHLITFFLGFLILCVILVIGGDVLINKPLHALTEVMKKVKKGDLSVRAPASRKDEFGFLARSFNEMIAALEAAQREVEHYHRQQMMHADKMASLGEIVSGIAHEIKNPLAGISCAVQMCRTEMGGGDPKREIMGEVLNQVNRLDRIVKDLLRYSRPKPLQLVPSRIGEILDKALFFVYPESRKHDIEIEVRKEEDAREVMVDPDLLQQIFLNIVMNAVQAMPKGGRLLISIARQKGVHDAPRAAGEEMLAIAFRDTGKGIAPEDLNAIFEPFFTRKQKGTGLGLYVSRKIVQEHGGFITVQSEPGAGSTFTVFLPLRTAGSVGPAGPDSLSAA
ncbi:MAG: ATP-binding protein [Thermodesulfovibrionales bacterium]